MWLAWFAKTPLVLRSAADGRLALSRGHSSSSPLRVAEPAVGLLTTPPTAASSSGTSNSHTLVLGGWGRGSEVV